jgi:hypothetical protein
VVQLIKGSQIRNMSEPEAAAFCTHRVCQQEALCVQEVQQYIHMASLHPVAEVQLVLVGMAGWSAFTPLSFLPSCGVVQKGTPVVVGAQHSITPPVGQCHSVP